ncbi:MAG: aminomethyl-transferring glycine dehydrogenase subunit GcvPA [Treponema sp.]|nr:aminomethyl-transferring glycine dehydrogenase subunit GcvPA [Treponema sp.]
MPYIPVTDAQREDMLHRLGLLSLEDLFTDIPEEHRFPALNLESGKSELEVLRELAGIANANAHGDSYLWFLGAGAYDHFIPAVVPALASRGEFLTAYTPYQPEVSQGTLQAIFEYQSMVAELTGMDAVNASHYDGATALAEAVLMGLKNTEGHKRILLPQGLHPEYKAVIKTYLSAFECIIEEYEGSPAAAASALSQPDLAILVASYPDFFGSIPDLSGAAEAVHAKGGLFAVHADPIMLGLFKSPGAWGADIVTAEGQSLGNDLNYGGPFLGIMGTTNALIRRLPGRLVGETRDAQGRRGFVLTLVAREQHIRREKAVSNICSNQGLMALRSCIYLAMMGKAGLREAAELCWHNAHFAAQKVAAIPGFSVKPGLFFKEFVVHTPLPAEVLAEKLYRNHIVPGLPLSRYFPERTHELLVCATEKHSRSDIEDLATALTEASREAKR